MPSLHSLRLASLLFCLSPIAAAVAQTAPAPAEPSTPPDASAAAAGKPDFEVVVTGARVPVPIQDELADVTVINGAQIRRSGAITVADLLVRQPGIEMSRNGGPGTATSLFLRGADTRFTAVYINGVRVDSQSTGGAPWEAISLDQVDRIEILRGPAAAVYGSDAVAGVVQIFTKQGRGPFTPYVGIGAGNRRTGKAEAGFSGKTGDVDYALGWERDLSRGFNAMPANNPDLDGYRQTSVNGRLGWQINPAHRIDLTGTFNRMDAQYDAFNSTVDDHAINRLSTLGATWSAQWTDHYSTRLSASESKYHYETLSPPPKSTYDTITQLRNYLFQNEWKQGPHLVTAALERREDHLVNQPIDRSRHQDGVALGYLYNGGPHSLQVNVRHDRDSEFGGQNTGGLAYGYEFAPNWRVTAAAGTAFRVPTLYQRFSVYGQPGLQPEKGRNLEAGVRWQTDTGHAGLTVYRNRITNLINFGAAGPCASTYGCYENVGRAVLEGVTLSAGQRFGAVTLGGSLDLQNPHNADTGKLLARRSKRVFKLNADTRAEWGQQVWHFGGEVQASGSRYDDAANTTRLGGYTLFNTYASTTIARDWSLLARLDNLTNKQYQIVNGYATPGRTFFVGLRWSPTR